MIKIAIDTGGTFTDYVVVGNIGGQNYRFALKNPTDHQDPSNGVLEGLKELSAVFGLDLGGLLSQTEKISLGSTLALNALLEKKGVKTALFTTEGFRDALEIRRAQLENQWDLSIKTPDLLVARHLRLGIEERLDYQGHVLKSLNEKKVREACQICRDKGVEAIAVTYLFSFLNPLHEEKTAGIIKEECPDVFISLSSQVAPRIREYERTMTTVINAYCTPLLKAYLIDLNKKLAAYGWEKPLHIMKNSGGLGDTKRAEQFGVQTLLSGPAGGAVANEALGKILKRSHTVLADMGGTSFDLHVISRNNHSLVPHRQVAGYPLTIPMVDIHSIGAGGGSIVHVEAGGQVRIGPDSAGSVPGPACYNLGGTEATVTDSLLVLGLINPANFPGQKISLSLEKSIAVIERKVAKPLGLTVSQAARMIYQITAEMMADAMRLVTSQKGNDPRIYSLIAAGGAFGLFATKVMESLHLKEVIIPVQGPVFCSWGIGGSSCRIDLNQSILMEKKDWDFKKMNQKIKMMKETGFRQLNEFGLEKINQDYALFLEMRYVGQHHEISVPWKAMTFDQNSLTDLEETFYQTHEAIYEYAERDKDWEVINLHLACFEKNSGNELFPFDDQEISSSEKNVCGELFGLKGAIDLQVYPAVNLKDNIYGPVLIDFKYTSVLVPKDFTAHLENEGILVIRKEN